MEITENRQDGRLVLEVSGRVDTNTAPALEAKVKEILDDTTDLIIDLADVQYVSSAGLRVILFAQQEMGKRGTLTVIHPNEYVMQVLVATGISDILTIEQ
jgi:anti-sigma B factor antagonist